MADLAAAVDPDNRASEVSNARLVECLMQFQRDNWDAATRRHEHTVAIIESINRAASGSASIAAGLPLSTDSWFSEHYYDAATELLEFLGEESMHLEGLDVADVGCGDGIIDLGLVLRGKPRSFVGYDIKPTDVDQLREVAKREQVADDLPPNLTFETCQADRIPAADASYDLVVSWSAFEHVSDPPVVGRDSPGPPPIRRSLHPALAVLRIRVRVPPRRLVPRWLFVDPGRFPSPDPLSRRCGAADDGAH